MRRGRSKKVPDDRLGTVDRAIREKKIFTALVKMPDGVQEVLLENGWIGKTPADNNASGGDGAAVVSLHKNASRVKAVAKRYESGLLWTDTHAVGAVDWSTLHPSVVVNRFPRRGAVLKLCGRAMAGDPEFDAFYPRTYPVSALDRFVRDYALTACASLLRAFIDRGPDATTHAGNGRVPLSALHFAMNKCDRYDRRPTDTNDDDDDPFAGVGPEWETFFGHYYRMVHDNQRFAMPNTGRGDLMNKLMALCRHLLRRLADLRPQTAMDGRRNVWIVKSARPDDERPVLLNKKNDIVERLMASAHRTESGGCGGSTTMGDGGNGGWYAQKYVETPLLCKGHGFDVRTWLLVCTLDDQLTAWAYQTCCLQFRSQKFSLTAADGPGRASTTGRSVSHASVQTCALKQLKAKLWAMQQGPAATAATTAATNNDTAVYSIIRRALERSAAAGARAAINLRPNCFEVFRATFVVGDDLRPWLIDVESDPVPAVAFSHAMTTVANAVAKNVAQILAANDRASRTKIGRFELIHKTAMPGGVYVPRSFGPRAASVRAKTARRHRAVDSRPSNEAAMDHRWNDGSVSTYIENIHVTEWPDDGPTGSGGQGAGGPVAAAVAAAAAAADEHVRQKKAQRLAELERSMARLKTGCTINKREAHHCLLLLDEWKTRVKSAHKFYKTIIAKNNVH